MTGVQTCALPILAIGLLEAPVEVVVVIPLEEKVVCLELDVL